MKAESVNRQIRSREPLAEIEDDALQSSMHNQGSTSPLVAMVACNMILLFMLSA